MNKDLELITKLITKKIDPICLKNYDVSMRLFFKITNSFKVNDRLHIMINFKVVNEINLIKPNILNNTKIKNTFISQLI